MSLTAHVIVAMSIGLKTLPVKQHNVHARSAFFALILAPWVHGYVNDVSLYFSFHIIL